MRIREKIHSGYKKLKPNHQIMVVMFATVIALVLIALLFKGCSAIASSRNKLPTKPMILRQGNQIKIPKYSPLRTQIMVETVVASKLPHQITVPGLFEINPANRVNIFSPLTGRLVSLNVNLGDFVKPNQVIAEIRSSDLAQAYADYENAKGMFELTAASLKRAKAVQDAGGISVKGVQQVQNDYRQALIEKKRTKTKLIILGKRVADRLIIRAPIEGRVTTLNYGAGSYINDLTTPLMAIDNLSTLWLTAYVPENLVSMVSQNQAVQVHLPAYPNRVLHGKIDLVNSMIDSDTRRNKTRIVFSNADGQLQPNMFAKVDITIPQSYQILIPLSAVLMNNDATSVFVETTPWCFKSRKIQLGTEDAGLVRVLSGLQAGERIAASGGILIND